MFVREAAHFKLLEEKKVDVEVHDFLLLVLRSVP